MARKIAFEIGEYYHLYNRGSDKRTVFETSADYERFLALLYICNDHNPVNIREMKDRSNLNLHHNKREDILDTVFNSPRFNPHVAIGAYCLMPNHFHLLIKEVTENGISVFMQKLSTAYTMYFNKKNERTGALFQGRFKAQHARTDEHLKYLYSYMHLNPIKLIESKWKEDGIKNKKKADAYLSTYSYSSYFDYLEKERGMKTILSPQQFPLYFEKAAEFESMTKDWLRFKETFESPES
jgi:putative transposase